MIKKYGLILNVDRDETDSYFILCTDLFKNPVQLERVDGHDAMVLMSSIFDVDRAFVTLKENEQRQMMKYKLTFNTESDVIIIYRISTDSKGSLANSLHPVKTLTGKRLRDIFYIKNIKTIL